MIQRSIEKKRSGEGGFTLVELLIVIVILGILAAIVVLAIGGLKDTAQNSSCKPGAKTIESAEDAYFAPRTTPTAVTADLMTAKLLKSRPECGTWTSRRRPPRRTPSRRLRAGSARMLRRTSAVHRSLIEQRAYEGSGVVGSRTPPAPRTERTMKTTFTLFHVSVRVALTCCVIGAVSVAAPERNGRRNCSHERGSAISLATFAGEPAHLACGATPAKAARARPGCSTQAYAAAPKADSRSRWPSSRGPSAAVLRTRGRLPRVPPTSRVAIPATPAALAALGRTIQVLSGLAADLAEPSRGRRRETDRLSAGPGAA